MLFVTGTLSGASFREARGVYEPQRFKILFFSCTSYLWNTVNAVKTIRYINWDPQVLRRPSNYLVKWRHCMLYWNYHSTLHIVRVKIVSWQIWVYNSAFLLHLVVLVVVIHCSSPSRDVTARRRRRAFSRIVVIIHCRPVSSLYIVSTRFVTCCDVGASSCVLARRRRILPLCIVVVKWQSRPFFSD